MKGRRIVDRGGRQVALRGMAVITNKWTPEGPKRIDLEEWNFKQMASWGFNAQQIRLQGGRLGVAGTEFDPAYLDQVNKFVTLAARHGIYSFMKMTVYDVPAWGSIGRAFLPEVWDGFWSQPEQQEDRIAVWRRIWERFAGRPEVLGYDILNEPAPGKDPVNFAERILYPEVPELSRTAFEYDWRLPM